MDLTVAAVLAECLPTRLSMMDNGTEYIAISLCVMFISVKHHGM